jgi:hypothetical protein
MSPLTLRRLGAVALLGVGLDHLQQFAVEHYSASPTIGTLFALNFAAATVVAFGLVLPIGGTAARLLACAGIGIAAGSIVALALSESTGLFGFMEVGLRGAIVLSLALEGACVLLLGASLIRGHPLRWRALRRATGSGGVVSG